MEKVGTCGIDFGTSNSLIAIATGNTVSTLRIGEQGDTSLRSLLYFSQNKSSPTNRMMGKKALEAYVNENFTGRLLRSIKRLASISSVKQVNIYNVIYTPEKIISLVLEELSKAANLHSKQEVHSVVLGRPVVFSDKADGESLALNRLTKAASMANFTNIAFEYEPVAAAYSYERTLSSEEIVLIVDVGGGTTDFSVLKLGPGLREKANRKDDILGIGGIPIGGDTFSEYILKDKILSIFGKDSEYESYPGKLLPIPNHFYEVFFDIDSVVKLKTPKYEGSLRSIIVNAVEKPGLKMLSSVINHNLNLGIFESVQRAKEALSSMPSTDIFFEKDDVRFSTKITQEEMGWILRRLVEKIDKGIDTAIASAGITLSSIDKVIITGGASLTHSLQSYFKTKFETGKLLNFSTFDAVAKGLAIKANNIFG